LLVSLALARQEQVLPVLVLVPLELVLLVQEPQVPVLAQQELALVPLALALPRLALPVQVLLVQVLEELR
jgi:hypothetical protein